VGQGDVIEIDRVAETQHRDPELTDRGAQPARGQVEIEGHVFEFAIGVAHARTIVRPYPSFTTDTSETRLKLKANSLSQPKHRMPGLFRLWRPESRRNPHLFRMYRL
jgi:hypothetical protein